MKKPIITVLILIPFVVFAYEIDSVTKVQLIDTGVNISSKIVENYIPGLPNELVVGIISAIFTGITGLIHRIVTIKKWKKIGKINKTVPPLK